MVKNFPFWWKQSIYAVCFIFGSCSISAQVNAENGATSVALSSADLFLINPWTVNTNPALLGKLDFRSLGVSYYSPYQINELSSRNIVLSAPFKNSGIGLSLAQFGYEKYREDKWNLSYGQNFGERFSMGVQVNYLKTSILEPYGSHGSFSFNMALFTKLSQQIELAAMAINPTNSKKDTEGKESYPQKFQLGINYLPLDQLSVILKLEKEHFHPLQIAAAIRYLTPKKVDLNIGYADELSSFSFGIGIPLKSFKFDISSTYSYQLGFTPAISLAFESFRKKQKSEKN